MELLRSLLFVPGNRAKMIDKAKSLPADALVLDLEDSVPIAEKEAARQLVRSSLPGLALKGQRVFVRINSLSTALTEDDLEGTVSPGLDGISLPKVESAEDVRKLETLIETLEEKRGLDRGHLKLIVEVETARGILNVFEVAGASSRLVGVGFGANDFAADMGIKRSQEGTELLYPRSMIAIAARAADVMALDGVYLDFRDEEGLIRDANLGRQLGFTGKFVIHPSQIEPINQVFRPSPDEIAEAQRVVTAFDAAVAQGAGSTSLNGRMIDIAVAQKARKTLALAEAIAKREAMSG